MLFSSLTGTQGLAVLPLGRILPRRSISLHIMVHSCAEYHEGGRLAQVIGAFFVVCRRHHLIIIAHLLISFQVNIFLQTNLEGRQKAIASQCDASEQRFAA